MPKPFSFSPFERLLAEVDRDEVSTFASVESTFVDAMSAFDQELVLGRLTSGQNQNKGLFFNELVARLIERCAGLGVAQRGKRPGILLPTVDVDLCFPSDPLTRPVMIAEVKMAGTPKHPGSPKAGVLGRPASADVDKRIREIALSVIDLKLADAEGGTSPIGDISSWIQETRPRFFALFGLRVIDSNDLKKVLGRFQYLANSYANGVGLALYTPVDPSTAAGRVRYKSIDAPGGMSVDDAVKRICRLIKATGDAPPKSITAEDVMS